MCFNAEKKVKENDLYSIPHDILFMKLEAMQIYNNRKFSGHDGLWMGLGEEKRRFKKRQKGTLGEKNLHYLYCGNSFTNASVCQNIKMYSLTAGSLMYTFIS